MTMASVGCHEPVEELPDETRDPMLSGELREYLFTSQPIARG